MESLRKVSFICCILGIFILLLFLEFHSKELVDYEEIEDLILGQEVYLEGMVSSQRSLGQISLINLNGVEVICECNENYFNKKVFVRGVVQEYNSNRQLRALQIKEIN